MKRFAFAALLAAVAVPALATDVGVSVSVGQPGFYGRIDIGDYPPPQVIYSEPIVVERVRRPSVVYEPIYLHVPPGHAKHWNKHCWRYNACGRPVYFVQDRWYNDVYVPAYREHSHRHGRDHDHRHWRDDDRGGGPGHGHGKGHGRGPDRDD